MRDTITTPLRARPRRSSILEPRSGVEDDDTVFRPNEAALAQLRQGGPGRAAFGTHVDAGARGELPGGAIRLFVGHRYRRATTLAEHPQADESAERRRHPQAIRTCVRVGPRDGALGALDKAFHHGRAAGGLHRDEAGTLRTPDPSETLHLVEGFPH